MDEAGKEYLLKNATSKYYRAVKMLVLCSLAQKRTVSTFDEKGFGLCGIEKAYKEGALPFNKPVSCHLYPIRVLKRSPGL